jgi:hypothetical protein
MSWAKNKIQNYILVISLLFICSVTCTAQNSFVKNYSTFSVSSPIKKTNLKINVGDEVHIEASGTIVLRGVTGATGPEGIDGFTNYRMDPVFEYGALLYKIGDDDWNIVDPEDSIIAERPGFLKFLVNNNDPLSNSGSFRVQVTVKRLKADNAPKIARKVDPEKVPANTSSSGRNSREEIPVKTFSHLTPGALTLSDLQKACSYNLNDAKSFLTSKQFKLDESNDHISKYSFNKDNVTASIIKDIKENQTTFATSSVNNYNEIKASLSGYRYTHRKLVKNVDGVDKYTNSRYSLIIFSFKLNNKYQYSFAIKKL